jgi:phage terminase large subunit-like protein
LWAEELFSWFYFVEVNVYDPKIGTYVKKRLKRRLINKQYLIIPRSAAKSMYASFIQSYFLNVDKSTTYQITTAPTMKQAEEVMNPIITSITRAKGPLFKFLTQGSLQNTTGDRALRQKLASTKKGIENFITGSKLEVRPMTIDKLQGLRCKCATVDEWLSCDTREDIMTALEQGCQKVPDWAVIYTSSEGTVRNGIGDSIKLELMDILKGEYVNPHVSIFYYRLDDIQEINNPELWIKANPNLNKTVSYEAYQLDVERAEHNPAARNDIIAKRFNIPMEGYTYFFTYEDTLPHSPRSFWKMPCSMGIDLSQGDDFCAFTFLFPLPDGSFGVKTRSYITQSSYDKLPLAINVKYQEFINEGSLIILEGTIIDLDEVYEDLDDHIAERQYDVRCIGFDPYHAEPFVARWQQENGPYGIITVRQGARTESVPLGELKKLAEDRKLIFDESIMSFTMGNAITIEDTNGNRKLMKKKHEHKIDNVAAMMDALVAYKDCKDMFL